MRSRAKHLALLGATAGLLGAGLAVPSAASAAPDEASDPLAGSGIAAWNIVAFWWGQEKANLNAATPYDVETKVVAKHLSKGGPSADGKPGLVAPIGGAGSTTSKNVNLPRTTGKVFFLDADKNPRWCTATSLQSKYRNLVATAGHCVYDTESNAATMKYWVFVPAYYQGKTPYGVYVGKQAFTHYDFDVYEDFDRDYAFVTVYNGLKAPHDGGPLDGDWKKVSKSDWDKYRSYGTYPWLVDKYTKKVGSKYYIWKFVDAGRLGDNVGGQGFAYNQKKNVKDYVFGYPSGAHPDGNHAYTGQTQKWCYGTTFPASASAIKAEELIGVKCSFTGEGSSGSAWMYKYSNTSRKGYLNGVTAAVSDTDGNDRIDVSLSPYFDGETYGIYKHAANLWSGSIA
ncbi:trypsin-like serine peptidase [Herbidospora sp. RD11066]